MKMSVDCAEELRQLTGKLDDLNCLLLTIHDAMHRNAFDAEFYSHSVFIAYEYLDKVIQELEQLNQITAADEDEEDENENDETEDI